MLIILGMGQIDYCMSFDCYFGPWNQSAFRNLILLTNLISPLYHLACICLPTVDMIYSLVFQHATT